MVELVIAWIIVGGAGGWLTGLALRVLGFGTAGDIAAGMLGGTLGGLVAELFRQSDAVNFGAWSMVVAFAGAVLFVPILRLFVGGRRAARM